MTTTDIHSIPMLDGFKPALPGRKILGNRSDFPELNLVTTTSATNGRCYSYLNKPAIDYFAGNIPAKLYRENAVALIDSGKASKGKYRFAASTALSKTFLKKLIDNKVLKPNTRYRFRAEEHEESGLKFMLFDMSNPISQEAK